MVGKDSAPLWSYLVTSGKFIAGDITQNLADQIAHKFVEARSRSEVAQTTSTTQATGEITLAAAGATFPAPLYQEWFESFHQEHPNITIQYSAIGSESGIRRLGVA